MTDSNEKIQFQLGTWEVTLSKKSFFDGVGDRDGLDPEPTPFPGTKIFPGTHLMTRRDPCDDPGATSPLLGTASPEHLAWKQRQASIPKVPGNTIEAGLKNAEAFCKLRGFRIGDRIYRHGDAQLGVVQVYGFEKNYAMLRENGSYLTYMDHGTWSPFMSWNDPNLPIDQNGKPITPNDRTGDIVSGRTDRT